MLDLKKEGLIKEIGVSNFDPFKFDAMNKAVDGALVTNQIEWNPVCFEHFNSGMMDYLTVNKIHPMIWSPLAGGRLFQEDDLQCKKAMDKIKEIAERHNCEPDTIVYAWIMYHPVQAMPIVGSRKVERIESAVKAMDVKLEHYVSPLGVLNDQECVIPVFFDEDLKEYEYIAVHPNDNTATIWMKLADLVNVIKLHGNQVKFINVE